MARGLLRARAGGAAVGAPRASGKRSPGSSTSRSPATCRRASALKRPDGIAGSTRASCSRPRSTRQQRAERELASRRDRRTTLRREALAAPRAGRSSWSAVRGTARPSAAPASATAGQTRADEPAASIGTMITKTQTNSVASRVALRVNRGDHGHQRLAPRWDQGRRPRRWKCRARSAGRGFRRVMPKSSGAARSAPRDRADDHGQHQRRPACRRGSLKDRAVDDVWVRRTGVSRQRLRASTRSRARARCLASIASAGAARQRLRELLTRKLADAQGELPARLDGVATSYVLHHDRHHQGRVDAIRANATFAQRLRMAAREQLRPAERGCLEHGRKAIGTAAVARASPYAASAAAPNPLGAPRATAFCLRSSTASAHCASCVLCGVLSAVTAFYCSRKATRFGARSACATATVIAPRRAAPRSFISCSGAASEQRPEQRAEHQRGNDDGALVAGVLHHLLADTVSRPRISRGPPRCRSAARTRPRGHSPERSISPRGAGGDHCAVRDHLTSSQSAATSTTSRGSGATQWPAALAGMATRAGSTAITSGRWSAR